MSNTSIEFVRVSSQERVPILAHDNLDGTYSQGVWSRSADRCLSSSHAASGAVTAGRGVLGTAFVIAAAGSTLKVKDGGDSSGADLVGTLSFSSAYTGPLPLGGIEFAEGIYVEITGTLQIVVLRQGA